MQPLSPTCTHAITYTFFFFFFLHVWRFIINKFNYIVKCRIQSHYFVRKKEKRRTSGISNLYNALIKINISLTNQNAASLSNVHTCNNVRVPGELQEERMAFGILMSPIHQNIQFRMILVVETARIALSRDNEFACIEIYIFFLIFFTCLAFHH
jgi:hypothetical protein